MPVNSRPRSLAAFGAVVECHGVQLRAQRRSLAVLVRVTGRVTADNRDQMLAHLRRLALVQDPLVLDLLDGDGFDADMLHDVVHAIDQDPRTAGSEIVFVAHGSADAVGSVGEAMRHLAARLEARRTFVMKSVAAGPSSLSA